MSAEDISIEQFRHTIEASVYGNTDEIIKRAAQPEELAPVYVF